MVIPWPTILAPEVHWRECYPKVQEHVAALLAKHSAPLTTMQLAERLWPAALARGPGITARKRLYKALSALAPHMEPDGWCHRGDPRPAKRNPNQTIRPWIWHAPVCQYKVGDVMEYKGARWQCVGFIGGRQ